MEMKNSFVGWNPWHGCTKISAGCRYCYVYRQDAMYGSDISSSQARKTGNFNLPVKRRRDGSWKLESGQLVFTCFTSDFLLEDADAWRTECWDMIRTRGDLCFYFFTKRIHRFLDCIPGDWGDGYKNVWVGCTVENQEMADRRLPLFRTLPIRRKSIIVAPMLGPVDLSLYLGEDIAEVSVGGESGASARPCHYEWVLDVRNQCVENNVPFHFHQTGANFVKDGRCYRIPRCHQHTQAQKARLDFHLEW